MDVAMASTLTDSYTNAARSSFTQASTKTLERSTERKEESNGALQEREDCCGDAPSPHTGSRMTTDCTQLQDTRAIDGIGVDHLRLGRNSCSSQPQDGDSSCDHTERENVADTRGIDKNSSTSQFLDQNIYSSDPVDDESEERADQEGLSATGDSQVDGAVEAETTQNCSHSTSLFQTVGSCQTVGEQMCQYGSRQSKWKEAAIYVSEGEDNEKFIHHPRGRWSKKAFEILHHPAYYITHLAVTVLLLLLVWAENYPSPRDSRISNQARQAILMVSTAMEILCLSFIAVYLILKVIWFGPMRFITSKGSVFNTLVLAVFIAEVFTILVRQMSHVRVSRALRPVFFLDNVLMDGVRRELRDIRKSLRPIVDVLFLLLFIILVFSLLGFYFFAEVDPSYFDNFKTSFVSLYILMTTANNPDVMLESYLEHPTSVIFYMVYIIVTVYFTINILTAVIYSSFSDANKTKFKKLYLHKRKALLLAYEVLAGSDGISFQDFLPFVKRIRPNKTKLEIMCIFKALHHERDEVSQHRPVGLEEFYSFYEVLDMAWKKVYNSQALHWHERINCLMKCGILIKVCHYLVTSKPFKISIYLVVLVNIIFLTIYTLTVDDSPSEDRFENLQRIYPISVVFTLIYCIEIVLKTIGYGPHVYYRKPKNVIDSLIIFISLILLLMEASRSLVFLAAARPIKLFRIMRLKNKYRDFLWTIVYITPKIVTVGIFLWLVIYSYAIVGLEFFNGKVFKGCCNESLYNIGTFYTGNIIENTTENVSPTTDVYFLLNFNDIGSAHVTLFTLIIGNNWHVIMEGFASETELSWLVRLYFLSFNIVILVIFEVLIAFIVEAFVYKVLARQRDRYCQRHKNKFRHCDCVEGSDQMTKVKITLTQEDLDEITHRVATHAAKIVIHLNHIRLRKDIPHVYSCFVGHRLKTKTDIQLQMYGSLLNEWVQESESEEARAKGRGEEDRPHRRTVVLRQLKKLYNSITE